MEEMTEEDVEKALEVLEHAKEILDEQHYWKDKSTLDEAHAILSISFPKDE